MPKQIGISPKVYAGLFPPLSVFLTSWVTTGQGDRDAAGMLVGALVGALAAYLAPPGQVVPAEPVLLPRLTINSDEVARAVSEAVNEPSGNKE